MFLILFALQRYDFIIIYANILGIIFIKNEKFFVEYQALTEAWGTELLPFPMRINTGQASQEASSYQLSSMS